MPEGLTGVRGFSLAPGRTAGSTCCCIARSAQQNAALARSLARARASSRAPLPSFALYFVGYHICDHRKRIIQRTVHDMRMSMITKLIMHGAMFSTVSKVALTGL